MQVFRDFPQYSPAYWTVRRGVPTASEFHRIISPSAADPAWTCKAEDGSTCGIRHRVYDAALGCSKKLNRSSVALASMFTPAPAPVELAAAHKGYINQLVGDLFDVAYPRVNDNATPAMRRGSAMEPQSRRWYEYETGTTVEEVGFLKSDCGRFGISPDGLCLPGGVECKNPSVEAHTGWMLDGVIPAEHMAQVHAPLALCQEIEWWDFVSHCPGLPCIRIRAERNEFTAKLREALELFWPAYQATLDRVNRLCGKEAAA